MYAVIWQSILYLAIPVLAIRAADRWSAVDLIGPVVVCYAVGIAVANLLPAHPDWGLDPEVARLWTEVSIPLAIPMILFPSDVRAWLSQSRDTVLSFLAAVVAVCLVSAGAAWYFAGATDEAHIVSGMLVGVYTGGTPNLMSIGMALEAREETFVLLNAADVLVSAPYLIFVLTVAKPVYRLFLPAWDGPADIYDAEDTGDITDTPLRERVKGMTAAFGLSVVILGISAGLSKIVTGEIAVAAIFLGLTTGGIAGSFVPRIRNLTGSYAFGDYLILVFCVAMGTRTDFAQLAGSGGTLLAYTAVVVIGAVLLHLLLAALLRIDSDTLIITSTAALFGPAFVAPVAEAMDNRAVILSGLTAGLVGYAVGNYLGLAMGWLLAA